MSNKKDRIWLAVMMVLVCFLLTACGCKHEETKVINTKPATCTEDGYTGDTQCLNCEKIITQGEIIPATGHTKGNPTDVADATCTTEGYTGNIYCITCGEMLTKGEAIAMIAHTPDDVHNAAEATCSAEGYTGDVLCKVCGTMLSQGQIIAKIEHTPDEIHNALAATCSAEGYTGDVLCKVCGAMLTQGESIAKLAHTPDEIHNAVAATCSAEGYTGDVLCKVCGEVLEQGTTIEMLPHTSEEQPRNASVPTCTQDGYSGDIYCSVCSALVTSGNAIPATGHSWGDAIGVVEPTCLKTGYSGDRTCTVCGTLMNGEDLAVTDHNFENNVCTICAWPVPGYYVEGELVMTWEDLKANGYIEVSEGVIVNAPGNFSDGVLVIGEDVTHVQYDDAFDEGLINASEVWLPRTISELEDNIEGIEKLVMSYCTKMSKIGGLLNAQFDTKLKDITLPETIKSINAYAFGGCENLVKINFPEGLTYIGEGAFEETALKEITFPSTLVEIKNHAFENSKLERVTLPEGIQHVSGFVGTQLTGLTIPSTVLELDEMPASLRRLDLSAATLCNMAFSSTLFRYGVGTEDGRLVLILPEQVLGENTNLSFSYYNGSGYFEEIAIPFGIKTLSMEYTDVLTLVIPTSVTKLTIKSRCEIGKIKYSGSEQQWRMIGGSDELAGIPIEFNYKAE